MWMSLYRLLFQRGVPLRYFRQKLWNRLVRIILWSGMHQGQSLIACFFFTVSLNGWNSSTFFFFSHFFQNSFLLILNAKVLTEYFCHCILWNLHKYHYNLPHHIVQSVFLLWRRSLYHLAILLSVLAFLFLSQQQVLLLHLGLCLFL